MKSNHNTIIEFDDCIAVIKINNPPYNYLEKPLFIPIETFRNLLTDKTTKGIVITGVGRHFSAGADLENLFQDAREPSYLFSSMNQGKELLNAISYSNIPVVAAISGACFGGGLEIALSCHLRFASQNAIFAFPEVNNNLMPGLGGVFRMVNKCGTSQTLMTVMSGDIINTDEALKKGIVDKVFEKDVLQNTILYLKNMLESRPKKVIMHVMQAIHNAHVLPMETALENETRLFCELAADEALRRKDVQNI